MQGDHYLGSTNNGVVLTDPTISEFLTGENLLMRWRHVYDKDSDWSIQAYYDNFSRVDSLQSEIDKTLDVELQYRFPWGERHSITCGAGFRNIASMFSGGDRFTTFLPSPWFTTNYTNEFVQDEMAIVEDRLALTLGCKLDQNPYTGLEYEPTMRLLWTPDHKHTAWGAISRAVRTPSRAEEQATETVPYVPPLAYARTVPTGGLVSEALLAYEIGYREQTTDQFSWDIATFYNVYDHVVGATARTPFYEPLPPPPHLVLPFSWNNAVSADTYGMELAANYSVSKRWRLYAQYTVFEMNMWNNPSHVYEGHDPHNQVYLRSSWDLRENLDFDLIFRYVDSLAMLDVPSYTSMDLRLAWRPRKNLEWAIVGQNLLQAHHFEYANINEGVATEVPRSVYSTITWKF